MKTLLLVGCLLLLPVVASAQVKNPSAIEFTSPDHAQLTAYEVDIFLSTACPVDAGAGTPLVCQGAPIQTLTVLSSSAAAQPNGVWRLTLSVQPISFGNYMFVVRPVAGAIKGIESVPSDAWVRAPGAPSKPVAK